MNSNEKRILNLAVFLFVLGVVFRYLPWGLPSIETFQVGEPVVVPASDPAPGGGLALESDGAPPVPHKEALSSENPELSGHDFTDKVNKKKAKSTKRKVHLPLAINSASSEDLCALNGVGPKLAEKIIAFREASGPFKSPKDLEKVPGIGKKKLEGILPGVIFD